MNKSEEMAKIAKSYHDELQTNDTHLHIVHDKREARKWSLAEIPNGQKLNTPTEQMNETLKEEHILKALLSSKSGSTAGMDRIPYDTWKLLHKKHQEASQNEKPSFDIIKTMTYVMTNIQIYMVCL